MASLLCPSEARLREALLGVGDPADLDALMLHLEACPACERLAQKCEARAETMLRSLRNLSAAGRPAATPRPPAADDRTPDMDADRTPKMSDPDGPADADDDDAVGSVIAGRYAVVRQIGEGGMGTVYLADQREPVRRPVALKLIRAGTGSAKVSARFEAERQALAMMDHPNIARVYDGGTTRHGRPFFVMEYVAGVSITRYCDDRRLPVAARLELFVQVCQAVQHAHQKGVIHRDLKPGNVLVTEVDGRPTPKVIDFGVAKATLEPLSDKSLGDTGMLVGTPVYMAPEQTDPGAIDIDTRADVYSLGVVLYELLTGGPALDRTAIRQSSLAEVLQAIREADAPRPSVKVKAAADLPGLAAARGTTPGRLVKSLDGDLDWIVLKALEKDRDRRYPTANGFAADLLRHLANEPVQARPPGRGYRLAKAVRRNRGLVAAAAVVLVALVVGMAGTSYGLVRADRQRGQAVRNFERSEQNYHLAREAVDRFLVRVSEDRLLNEPHMDGLRAELLGSAREFYEKFRAARRDDPTAVKDLAAANVKLGQISWWLGDHADALAHLRASRPAALAPAPGGVPSQAWVTAGLQLGGYLTELGRVDEADRVLEESVAEAEARQRALPDEAAARDLLGRALAKRADLRQRRGDNPAAMADLDRAAAVMQPVVRELGDLHAAASYAVTIDRDRGNLAWLLGDAEKAARIRAACLDVMRRRLVLDPRDVVARHDLATTLSDVAIDRRGEKRFDQADAALGEAVAVLRELVREHPAAGKYVKTLAGLLNMQSLVATDAGDRPRAAALTAEAIDLLGRLVDRYPAVRDYALDYAQPVANTGNACLDAGRWQESLGHFDRAILAAAGHDANDTQVRKLLRNCHWGRADAFAGLRQFPAAVAAYDAAAAFADAATRPEIRMGQALALAKSGDHAAARRAAENLTAAVPPPRPFLFYDAARVLRTCGEAAGKDTRIAAASLPTVVEAHNAQSVDFLRRAFEAGHFADAGSQSSLIADEWKAFEDRADFKELRANVAAQAVREK